MHFRHTIRALLKPRNLLRLTESSRVDRTDQSTEFIGTGFDAFIQPSILRRRSSIARTTTFLVCQSTKREAAAVLVCIEREKQLDRKMSARTSSSSAVLLPALMVTAVLSALLTNSGCMAAGSAKPMRRPEEHPKQPSTTSTDTQVNQLKELLVEANRKATSMKSSAKSLQQKYSKYMAQVARNGWPTAQKQHFVEESLRNNAQHLRTNFKQFENQMRSVEPRVKYLRGLARQGPNRKQMEQNIKLYEIIMNLVKSFIECPGQILDLLGGSDSDGVDSLPTEGEENGTGEEELYQNYY
nr:uncharacterized protein LOC109419202 [Aedes albopictus]